ncbi:MAG: hypothetical protein F6K14_31600, partial [Symploca sp. SIO2C1]|nr:hypothetical protein [Symploca sp. SIO2C1]
MWHELQDEHLMMISEVSNVLQNAEKGPLREVTSQLLQWRKLLRQREQAIEAELQGKTRSKVSSESLF